MKKIKMKAIVVGIILLILFCIIGYQAIFNFNNKEYTITVTDKDRIYKGKDNDSSSKYLVFGDDENGNALVFENTDCFIRGKWNSSNIQGKLKEGNTYKITVIGYRIAFFSWYQNIIKVEEIE